MRKILTLFILTAPLALLPTVGAAKGCIKGAAVGGVAGHVAGHHAVACAAAGCVIQHHREKVKAKGTQAAPAGGSSQPGQPATAPGAPASPPGQGSPPNP